MIIVITGPTAVGKTKLSIEVAKYFNAEIINADSMQFYKYLDIGTAKIKDSEKEGITHHLFDIVNPEDLYSIYDYEKDGREVLNKLIADNKNVVIVGGSALYIKALLYNYEFETESKTYTYTNLTNEELLKEIQTYDLNIDIHLNNRKRLERTLTKLRNNSEISTRANEKLYDFALIALTADRKILYKKIDERVDAMFDEGLLSEVKALYDKKINSKAINTGIGYKELYTHFDNKITLDEAKELIARNTRRYAKRQFTFLKHQMKPKYFETNYENFDETTKEVINYIKEIG